jgi:hypothetical protein
MRWGVASRSAQSGHGVCRDPAPPRSRHRAETAFPRHGRPRQYDLQLRQVSNAIGLADRCASSATDGALLSVRIVVSVSLNALVSPVLGALSDRGGQPGFSWRSPSCVSALRRSSPTSGRPAAWSSSSSRTSPTRPRSSTTTRRSRRSAGRRAGGRSRGSAWPSATSGPSRSGSRSSSSTSRSPTASAWPR